MFGKINLIFMLLSFSLHLFAYDTNSMKRNYHNDVKLPETILHPLIQEKKIIKIKVVEKQKAGYLGMDSIYVKENIRNLGKYTWYKRYKAYINSLNRRELIFKKNKEYLISKVQYKNLPTLDGYLSKINKKKISDQDLKEIFNYYNDHSINEENMHFYHSLVSALLKERMVMFRDKEYFFLVDKKSQRGYIFFFRREGHDIEYIGSDKISTGNPSYNSRNDRYFETPIGIINRARYRRGDWRAAEKNSFKYGERSDRIYYLGKYLIPIADESRFKREVHLAIHSTTPIDAMLLGHKVSKGCIRISRELNKILNRSAILDGKRGKYVIIVDSSLPIAENLRRLEQFSGEKLKNSNKYAMVKSHK